MDKYKEGGYSKGKGDGICRAKAKVSLTLSHSNDATLSQNQR